MKGPFNFQLLSSFLFFLCAKIWAFHLFSIFNPYLALYSKFMLFSPFFFSFFSFSFSFFLFFSFFFCFYLWNGFSHSYNKVTLIYCSILRIWKCNSFLCGTLLCPIRSYYFTHNWMVSEFLSIEGIFSSNHYSLFYIQLMMTQLLVQGGKYINFKYTFDSL